MDSGHWQAFLKEVVHNFHRVHRNVTCPANGLTASAWLMDQINPRELIYTFPHLKQYNPLQFDDKNIRAAFDVENSPALSIMPVE